MAGYVHFEIYENGFKDWRWRLRAANGEPVASGESYTTERACRNGIRVVQETTLDTPIERVDE